MTTYNTGNPLGSSAAKDLYDNAQNLDYALNSITQAIWRDRLGRNRRSYWGMEQEFSSQLHSQEQRFNIFIQNSGYQVIGDYVNGPLTIDEYNQLIRYNGELWKITAATNIPYTTTGNDSSSWVVDSTHFVSVGDAALRQNLASSGDGLGDALIAVKKSFTGAAIRTQHDVNAEWISITDFDGVVGDSNEFGTTGTDCTVGIQKALNSGASNFFIPDKFFRISDTLYIPSGVRIFGSNMWKSCIVADPTMDGVKDVMQNVGWGSAVLTYDKNIQLSNFRIKANGYSRVKSNPDVEWGRCLRTGALDGLDIDSMVFQEGPQHCLDIACWKDNYVGVGHAGITQGMTTNFAVRNSFIIDYCYDDGITTHGASGGVIDNCTQVITDYGKSMRTHTITQNGVEIDDGSYNITVINSRTYGNNTITKGFATANHPDNPIPYNIRFINCDSFGTVAGVAILGVADNEHPLGSENFRGSNYAIINCSLNYPSVDTTNTEFPSRAFDIQSGSNVRVENFRINMRGPNGESSRSPCAVINMIGNNIIIDGVRVEGVPNGNLGTAFGTGRAWFRITNTASSNFRIKNIDIDNIGWADRVIRDVDLTTGGSLIEVDGIKIGSISTDGRTKIGIMSAANATISDINVPVGMQRLAIGRTLSAHPEMTGDVKVNSPAISSIIGGMRIRSETAADGSQPAPGLLFDRQFVSPSSSLGKGSVAFRMTPSQLGGFSVSAYNEATNSYEPIHVTSYDPSNLIPKYMAPVKNGDCNLGNSSSAWLNGYFVNSPQTVSDARFKSEVRALSQNEISAGLDIIKKIGFWTWLSDRGDREHSGTTVQTVIDIMEKNGLIPFNYSFITYDKWDDEFEISFEYDSDGKKIPDTEVRVQTKIAGDIYGFKVQELLMFLLSCIGTKLL
ncbi:hypothetical protein [Rahnella sp. NRRL B-41462]|uniref:tail fiber domain-containing protein n=1 Tax=Rahnella sp. NRRL B-41462 TaxID=1610579 RepID=UPI001300A4A9|nr:hypothetical protein [Rahnella sp. NRRL B-41462]